MGVTLVNAKPVAPRARACHDAGVSSVIGTDQLLAFGIAAAILIVIPGPSVIFVIGRALTYGRTVALASVIGNTLGLVVIALLVAVGLGVVVAESVLVLKILKFVGAA
jgi:threonine/homoserine/homoserine lactone efflux protein